MLWKHAYVKTAGESYEKTKHSHVFAELDTWDLNVQINSQDLFSQPVKEEGQKSLLFIAMKK